jgi:hypothetical protein
MKTGFKNLDEHIGGINDGELIILGGSPAMGKTSLAIGIARNCKKNVLYFSLERLAPQQHGILLSEYYPDGDEPKRRIKLFGETISEIRKRVVPPKDDVDLIIIDYVQLLDTKEPIKELKKLAQQINKPILALSWIKRSADLRKDHRPRIGDLAYIGKEQIAYADDVLLLYRDSVGYDSQTDIAEVIICKNPQMAQSKIFLQYKISKDGMSFFDYMPKAKSSSKQNGPSGIFESDLEYAKKMVKNSFCQDLDDCKKTTFGLERLHQQYHKYYNGYMRGVYHPHNGAGVIAWEYAKGLVALVKMQLREDKRETVARLEALYGIYNSDVTVAESYAAGLAYSLGEQSAEEIEKTVISLETLHEQHPRNEEISRDYGEGLACLLQRQILDASELPEALARIIKKIENLRNLSAKLFGNEYGDYLYFGCFAYPCYSEDAEAVLKCFKVLMSTCESKIMAEAIASGLNMIPVHRIIDIAVIREITKCIARLNTVYFNNEFIASEYAEALFYLAEMQLAEKLDDESRLTIAKLDALGKRYPDNEMIALCSLNAKLSPSGRCAAKIDCSNVILTYGLTKKENELLKKGCADFEFYDISPCFSDLLALNSIAIIINPKTLQSKSKCKSLIEAYSCGYAPLFIFTSDVTKLGLPEFMNNVCDVSYKRKMTTLLSLAKHFRLCYEDAKEWLDAKAGFASDDGKRVDNAQVKRVELRCGTKKGGCSVISATDLVNRAAEWNHRAIAITDCGAAQAFPEVFRAAKDKGIKIIYGTRITLFTEDIQNTTCHATLLAKNMAGLKNLYKIISLCHINSPHPQNVPLISDRILAEHREGLLIGAAWELEAAAGFEELLRDAMAGQLSEKNCFYDYLEIMPCSFIIDQNDNSAFDFELLSEMNKKIAMFGEKLNTPVVAVGDVHFLNPEDRKALSVLTGYEPQPPRYFRTTEEMLAEFEYLGKEKAYEVVVANTNIIADMIEDIKPVPEGLFLPKIDGADKDIAAICNSRAKEIYGTDLPRSVRERLDTELDSITKNGYSSMYMIVRKLVKKFNDDGYHVGSRGYDSASLVAYLLGITEIDPLKYNIPFESFAGLGMDGLPDFSFDFSGDSQSEIHRYYRYVEEMLGKYKVARGGTECALSEQTAREYVSKYYIDKRIFPYPQAVNSLASAIAGVKRTMEPEPGHLLIIPQDKEVCDFTPLQYPGDDAQRDVLAAQFGYGALHDTLCMFVFSERNDLTMISKLEHLTGIDAKKIPLNDEKTLTMFINANTLGVPRFGGYVRNMLKIAKPKTFDDLAKIHGLSCGIDVWEENAEALIKSGTAAISEVIALKDDIMVYLIDKGICREYAYEIMEDVTAGNGLTDGQADLMAKADVPSWYINSCNKIDFLQGKAIVVAHTVTSFRIAWFKAHYPDAFYKAYFEVESDFIASRDSNMDFLALDISETKKRIKKIKGDAATYEGGYTYKKHAHATPSEA